MRREAGRGAAPRGRAAPAATLGHRTAPAWRREALLFAAIVAVGAVLRLLRLGSSPPGLNQDEAVNAWNAFCLLRTGHDMNGIAWPVFYSHAIGDNRTTLFFYALMPFQALGGLSVLTTRLPSVVAGIAFIAVAGLLGRRLAGPTCGLWVAALAAIDPWAIFMSRWGIEGGLCPLLGVLPVTLLVAAGFPIVDRPGPARPWLAAVAGGVAGVACYGYWPLRLHLPVLLALSVALQVPAWRTWLRAPHAARAGIAFAVSGVATAGPLLWRHLTDPAIAHRATMTALWEPGTPLPVIAGRVLGRYLGHFGPDFLFVTGDTFDIVKPIGQGQLPLYMLPILLAGAAFAIVRFHRSPSARLVVALVLAYPAGDVLARYASMHAMRSAPGLGALAVLAGYGASQAMAALAPRRRLQRIAAGVMLAWMLVAGVRWASAFYGPWNRRPEIHVGYHVALLEAVRRVAPREPALDAIVCTTTRFNAPFAIALVASAYDPRRWFTEPRIATTVDGWETCRRFGKWRFWHDQSDLDALTPWQADAVPQRVAFIVRPGELGIRQPSEIIRDPEGREELWIVYATL